jgi:cell division protease FtsH
MAGVIDDEISGLVERAHEQAREILIVHRSVLDRLSEKLIEQETLDGDELDEILHGVAGSPSTEQRFVANTKPSLDPQPAEQMRAEGLDQ